MEVPLQIAFQGLDPSEFIEKRLREEVDRLERFYKRLVSCRVVVIAPHQRHRHGDLYEIHIHLGLPGEREIVVRRNPKEDHAHADVYVAIRDAFNAARRVLQDEARELRGDIKHHEPAPEGHIASIVAEQDYGFIRSADDREIYFHRHSVADDGFDLLKVGDPVHFKEEMGDKGPQASAVKPTGKHHVAETD